MQVSIICSLMVHIFSQKVNIKKSYKCRLLERSDTTMPVCPHQHRWQHLWCCPRSAGATCSWTELKEVLMQTIPTTLQNTPLPWRALRAESATSHPFPTFSPMSWAGTGIFSMGQDRPCEKDPEKGSFLWVISGIPWEEPMFEKIASAS